MEEPQRQSRWDRFLLSVMGPPQLGDVNAPMPDLPEVEDICPRCHAPRSEHVIERAPGRTHSRCPAAS